MLRAGIHPNPGPSPGSQNFCPICQKRILEQYKSVRCSQCKLWCHLRKSNNCSQLKSDREYKPDYKCLICRGIPLPSQPTQPIVNQPSQPTQPVVNQPSQPTQPNVNQHPPPPATPPQNNSPNNTSKRYDLKILKLNCNGIRGKNPRLA